MRRFRRVIGHDVMRGTPRLCAALCCCASCNAAFGLLQQHAGRLGFQYSLLREIPIQAERWTSCERILTWAAPRQREFLPPSSSALRPSMLSTCMTAKRLPDMRATLSSWLKAFRNALPGGQQQLVTKVMAEAFVENLKAFDGNHQDATRHCQRL